MAQAQVNAAKQVSQLVYKVNATLSGLLSVLAAQHW